MAHWTITQKDRARTLWRIFVCIYRTIHELVRFLFSTDSIKSSLINPCKSRESKNFVKYFKIKLLTKSSTRQRIFARNPVHLRPPVWNPYTAQASSTNVTTQVSITHQSCVGRSSRQEDDCRAWRKELLFITPKNVMQVGAEGEIVSLLVTMREVRISIWERNTGGKNQETKKEKKLPRGVKEQYGAGKRVGVGLWVILIFEPCDVTYSKNDGELVLEIYIVWPADTTSRNPLLGNHQDRHCSNFQFETFHERTGWKHKSKIKCGMCV